MLIIRPYEPKILMPVPKAEWRTSSLAQPKDYFGNENQTRFRICGRLSDGYVKWVGWFDDRDDADAFLLAVVDGSIAHQPSLWRLPVPNWHPDFGEQLSYDFATVTFLSSGAGSNQTYNRPSDWNNSNNSIELLGGGACGGHTVTGQHGTGGGGSEYGKALNLTISSTTTYQIAAGVIGVASAGPGTNGNASWWNGTTQAAATLGALGGNAGDAGSGSRNGGAGGTGGVGAAHFAGGRGGNLTGSSGSGASGGGGAAGKSAAGNNGVDSTSTSTGISTAGGSGDGGLGGAGGAVGSSGGNGTEWDSSHGSGGGGGGDTGGGGGGSGIYGGGGAAGINNSSGPGAAGLIVITYTPKLYFSFNQSMLGL